MTTKRMDLPTLIDRFHDEERARRYLEDLRWPEGIVCTKCVSVVDRITPIPERTIDLMVKCVYLRGLPINLKLI